MIRRSWHWILLVALAFGAGCTTSDPDEETVEDASVDDSAIEDEDGGPPTDAGTDAATEPSEDAGTDAGETDAGPDAGETTCIDEDGDGYGVDCDPGDDCDDSTDTGAECHDGCGEFYIDEDGDGHGARGDPLVQCKAPANGVTVGDDHCDDTDGSHESNWTKNGCEECDTTDLDGDHYGADCDLGDDCDESGASGNACHQGCGDYYFDVDGDGHAGTGDPLVRCTAPANSFTTADDHCDDTDGSHESNWTADGCDDCDASDRDGDHYGADCDLGDDCNEHDASVNPGAAAEIDWNQLDDDCDGDFGNDVVLATDGAVAGMTRAVYAAGGYVYSGSGGTLEIFTDAGSDSALVSRVRVPDVIQDIFVAGTKAYLASGEGGLFVVDVTVPSDPGIPIQFDTPNDAKGVHVVGNWAYVADQSAILAIDVSNSKSDSTSDSLAETATELQVVGNYLFYAGSGELGIVDVSTPGTFGNTYSKTTSESADGIAVANNHAYLSHNRYGAGLIIVDVTDPTAPGNLYTHTTAGNDYDVTVAGNHAYVGSTDARFFSVDVTHPEASSDVATIYPGLNGWPVGDAGKVSGRGYKSAASGDNLYLAAAGGLWSVDISDPASPGPPMLVDFGGSAVGLAASENHLYYHGWLVSKVPAIDVSNPALPVPVGSANLSGIQIGAAFATADDLYLARRTDGYRIADLSDPTAPAMGSAHDAGPDTRGLWVEGNTLYTASGASALGVVDVTDPGTPGTVTYYGAGGAVIDVQVAGNYAFVTTNTADQLQVYEVTNPTVPSSKAQVALTSTPRGLDIDGGWAFMASSTTNKELVAVDVSTPTTPGTPVYVDLDQTSCYDVVVYRGHAFVKCEKALAIVDMTTPATPGTVRSRPLAGNLFSNGLQQLIEHNGHIFVADYDNGVEIFKVWGLQ